MKQQQQKTLPLNHVKKQIKSKLEQNFTNILEASETNCY